MSANEPTPIDLSDILRIGAVFEGRLVKVVALTWDGGELRSELPVIEVAPVPKPSAEVKRLANAIIAVLAELPAGGKRRGPDLASDVERRTGEETDYKSGTFARAIRHLKLTGQIPDDNTEGYSLNP